MVHKFVTRGTIEEKIDVLIREKQEMADALLNGGGERALTEISDEEILKMVSLDIEHASIWARSNPYLDRCRDRNRFP